MSVGSTELIKEPRRRLGRRRCGDFIGQPEVVR